MEEANKTIREETDPELRALFVMNILVKNGSINDAQRIEIKKGFNTSQKQFHLLKNEIGAASSFEGVANALLTFLTSKDSAMQIEDNVSAQPSGGYGTEDLSPFTRGILENTEDSSPNDNALIYKKFKARQNELAQPNDAQDAKGSMEIKLFGADK